MVQVCPHCGRNIGNKFALHVSGCPLSPEHKANYRAAMEDPSEPGALVLRKEYDKRRQAGMSSGGSLNQTFKLDWPEIGKLFGLGLAEDELEKEANEDVRQMVEQDRRIQADARSVGLSVLRHETEQVGNVFRRTYMLR